MTVSPLLAAAAIAVVAIVSATLCVCLHAIDSATYGTIVAGFAGAGVGAGTHASGVRQGQK